MAFDLESAIPVDAPKFDLSSAKPVASPKEKRKARGFSSESEQFSGAGETALGAGEAGIQMLTGALATPVAGLAGLVGSALPGPEGQGARVVEKVQHAATYQPRTETGRAVSRAVSLPMEIANRLLGKASGAAGSLVGPKTEAAGRVIGENAIPMAAALYGGAKALSPMEPHPMVPGKDFSPLRELTPEQADRFHRMKGQGVDPTLGNVTRDPAQVRFEQQTAGLDAGKPLYQRGVEQDAALTKHVEGMKPKGASNVSVDETSRSMRKAVEAKKAAKDEEVNAAYEKARAAGETKQEVDVSPLIKYLADNEPATVAVPAIKAIGAKLRKLMGEEEDVPAAQPVGSGKVSGKMVRKPDPVAKPTPKVTIDDLELLRQEVGRLGLGDGSVKKYMGDIRQIIDKVTDGAGGKLYQEARAKRKKVGDEFEEQAAVNDIIEKKSRTDYKVAGEDVWHKTVIGGGTDDLVNVIKTLRTAGDKQKPQSLQALKDMQARTVDYILEDATRTGTFSPAGFDRAVKKIGEEKLTYLLGPKAVGALKAAGQTATELKKPPVRVPGSDTSLNQRAMVEKLATDHATNLMKGILPRPLHAISKVVDSMKEGAAKRAEAKKMTEAVDEAMVPRRAPLADIAAEADKIKKERRRYVMKEAGSRAVIPAASTIRGQNGE